MKDQNYQQKSRRPLRPWDRPDRGSHLWRRVWLLLLLLLPLIGAALAERRLEQIGMEKTTGPFLLVGLLLGGLLLVLLLGWGCWHVRRQPASQAEREAARRRERRMLLRLARGKRPWHAHRVTQGILTLLGLCFFLLGPFLEIQTRRSPSSSRVEMILLGIAASLGGLLLLWETLVVLPRRLKRLSSQSATILKTHLLAEEYQASPPAFEQEEHPEEN